MKERPKNAMRGASNKGSSSPRGKNVGLFGFFDSILNLDKVFADGIPPKYIPRILFISAIGIFYIGNSHFANTTIIKLSRMKTETEDLRVDYTTLKADFMLRSKQSEVAKKVASMGLEESSVPPQKITLEE